MATAYDSLNLMMITDEKSQLCTMKFGMERDYNRVFKFRMKRKCVYRITETDTSIFHLPPVLSGHAKRK
jgi:hypothetical protein